jgi:hypothetical protein
MIIIIIIIIIISSGGGGGSSSSINCNWVDTRWQWYMYTKYDIGYY